MKNFEYHLSDQVHIRAYILSSACFTDQLVKLLYVNNFYCYLLLLHNVQPALCLESF